MWWARSQDVGKTVTSMGIIAKLLSPEHGFTMADVGYIKPVGQQTLTVLNGEGVPIEADKDAVVVTSLMGVYCHGYEVTSPVIWKGGLTAKFIDQYSKPGADPWAGRSGLYGQDHGRLYQGGARQTRSSSWRAPASPASARWRASRTPMWSTCCARWACPCFVALVTRGGIGSTIDEVFPYLMALDHMGTRIDGIIINGVLLDKIDKISERSRATMTDLFDAALWPASMHQPLPPILGFVPTIQSCVCPLCA